MYVCYTNQIGCTIKHQSNFLLLDVLLNTNQISCCWYVRRFDPDTVENGHIYSSVKEEEVFIYWVLWVRLRILWAGLIVISNWIISLDRSPSLDLHGLPRYHRYLPKVNIFRV